MATFIVRIVLHKAEFVEYKKLYESMNEEGFSDIIQSDKGINYILPDGEYIINGKYTRSDILSKAKSAIKKTLKEGSILITESNGMTWLNLDKQKS